jgi:DNA polymerase-3 subunit alpha (Gram-positive type)
MSNKEIYTVLDFETTGLDQVEERITQIAAIKVEVTYNMNTNVTTQNIEKFETLVNPGKEISEFITNLTGITNEMVKDAPTESEAILQLINFIGGSTIVAQNSPFDLGFLHHATLRANIEPKVYNFFCTRAMTAILFPNISHSLVDIVHLFDIELENAHNAMSDAQATFDLFNKVHAIYAKMGIYMMNKLVVHPDRPMQFTPPNAIIIKNKNKPGGK